MQFADAVRAFTGRLARAHGVVVVEDLATKNLMANRRLAAAIGDQGWAELARQLAYKTARHGGQLIRGGPLVRELQDVLGVWCGETRAHPRRAQLPLRRPAA